MMLPTIFNIPRLKAALTFKPFKINIKPQNKICHADNCFHDTETPESTLFLSDIISEPCP